MTDPRPLPDIPEVIDWINGSVDAGIPWFYFLRTGIYPQGLQLLLACGAKTEALSPDGSYLINIKKFRTFVLKNLSNLHAYIDKNGFPSESGDGIVNAVMCIVKEYVH